MSDKTIRELQSGLPWTGHYHRDFRATPMTHKDFQHALLHIHKAGGKLAAIINDAEHGGIDWAAPEVRAEVAKYVADMVICALRIKALLAGFLLRAATNTPTPCLRSGRSDP